MVATPDDNTRGEEIEITPEMIEAGVNAFALFSSEDRCEWIVSAIYRAMIRTATLPEIEHSGRARDRAVVQETMCQNVAR